MNFSRTEKLLLGLSLWGLLILLALPYVDFSADSVAPASAFATVIPQGDDVRQRTNSEFDWKSMNRSASVGENSRVYTGRQSHAKVEFEGGGSLLLEERTLVVLSRDAQRSRVLEIEQGMAFLDLPKGDVFVRIGGKLQKISGAKGKIRIERKGDDVVLSLASGSARLNDKDLSSGTKVSLATEKDQHSSLQILTPEDGGVQWTESRTGEVNFAWSQEHLGSASVTLRSLTTGRTFEIASANEGNAHFTDLPIDDYYWQVKQGSAVEHARFRLRSLQPPEFTMVRSRESALEMTWNDSSLSDFYSIVVEDAMTGKPSVSAETKDLTFRTPVLPRGTYNVRVSSFRAGRPKDTLVSKTLSHFHDQGLQPVNDRLALDEKAFKIELTWPGAETITTGFLPMSSARFGWKGLQSEHSVQIAGDYTFDHLVDQFDVSGSVAEWAGAQAGQFFVRVRPKGGDGAWSEVSSLRLIFAAPAITGLSRDLQTKSLRVVWDHHPRVKNFEVVTADNADFMNPSRVVTATPTASIPADKRRLYVRVRGLSAAGWPITRFSNPSISQPEAEAISVKPLAKVETPQEAPPNLAGLPAVPEQKASIDQIFRHTFRRVARFWAGLGLNYFRLGQTDSGALDQASFSNFTGPTMMAEVSAVFKEFYEVMIGYHDQPGRIDNEQFGLTATNSRWQTLMGDVSGTFAETEIADRPVRFGWKLGLQSHRFPFLFVQNGRVSQALNEVQNWSVGGLSEVELNSLWRLEAFLRYQAPFAAHSSAGEVTYKPVFSFDGSVGAVRRLSGNYLLGAYWFGQSQTMSYNYRDGSSSSAGTQKFFNSNLQLRFGYEWEKK